MGVNTNSRTALASKNFVASIFERFIKFLIEFITRTAFIKLLSATYLGVNGLFTNVLGLLSLAELGISTAISFSLYKPLAENDERRIISLIQFYKKAYRIIALVVTLLGLSIVPFLGYIVKEPKGVQHITLIYLLFLSNIVLSYLLVYKFTIFSADQKAYVISIYEALVEIVVLIVQLIVLVFTKNYLLYLISNIVLLQCGRFLFFKYTDKKYPYLKSKESVPLDPEDKATIITKIKALMFHKLGSVAVFQTDNIIISSIINVTTVGLVSNFTMFTTVANGAIKSLLNASIAGLGNIVAVESDTKKYLTFKRYDFIGFWLYAITVVALYFLMEPFVVLWIGEDKLIDTFTIVLLCLNYYFTGQRASLENMKAAAGIYEQDKWVPLVEAFVNLVVSVSLAFKMGLPGVYIGTFVSGLIPNLLRPYYVFKYVLSRSSKEYYFSYLLRICVVLSSIFIISCINHILSIPNMWAVLVIRIIECLIIPNAIIVLVFKNTDEYDFCTNLISRIIHRFSIQFK